jgi:hypothetical protein
MREPGSNRQGTAGGIGTGGRDTSQGLDGATLRERVWDGLAQGLVSPPPLVFGKGRGGPGRSLRLGLIKASGGGTVRVGS